MPRLLCSLGWLSHDVFGREAALEQLFKVFDVVFVRPAVPIPYMNHWHLESICSVSALSNQAGWFCVGHPSLHRQGGAGGLIGLIGCALRNALNRLEWAGSVQVPGDSGDQRRVLLALAPAQVVAMLVLVLLPRSTPVG